MALVALCGCIASAATLYVIHHLLPSNWLRALLAGASIIHITILRSTNYWQAQPLRVLFPCLFIAYILSENIRCGKFKGMTNERGLSFSWQYLILGTLAVLFNTESGIYCLISLAVYIVVKNWQKYKWYDKRIIRCYIYTMLYIVLSILSAVTITNIYNLCCRGPIIFKLFFFPLLEDSFIDDVLRYDIPWGNHAWVYVFILFTFLLFWSIYHTSWFKRKDEKTWRLAPFAALTSSLGLLNFTYYVNRAAYFNLDICFPMAICSNAIIIGELYYTLQKGSIVIGLESVLKRSLIIICISAMGFTGIHALYAPTLLEQRNRSGYQSLQCLEDAVIEISEMIPENTYGIEYVSALYHRLGWDNYGHFRDTPDMLIDNEIILPPIIEEVLKYDSFLVCRSSVIIYALLEVDPSYHKKLTIDVGNISYDYYVRDITG